MQASLTSKLIVFSYTNLNCMSEYLLEFSSELAKYSCAFYEWFSSIRLVIIALAALSLLLFEAMFTFYILAHL